ncbi:MAG: ABC transporter substrate-binding protein [Pseudomonadota bacterium]|nr:ABC transporter substrate-binding protein [Pseudomonadota bacterium]
MLIALLSACSDPQPTPAAPASGPPRVVKVALNWQPEPEFGGYYAALLDGAYKEAGLAVELLPGGPHVHVLEMLADGSVDVAISGADDLLVRRSRGLDAVALFPGFVDSPVGLMAHAEGGPTRFEDVTGPVAIGVGGPFQMFLWGRFGWDGKVAIVPPTGTIDAFAADPTLVQQAYISSEPCLAEGAGMKINFLPGRDVGWNPYSSLAVVRGGDAEADWVKAFRAASLTGWNAYLADPSRANAEITRLNPEMPADRTDCIVTRQTPYVTGAAGVGVMTAERWSELAAALVSVGQPADATGAWIP